MAAGRRPGERPDPIDLLPPLAAERLRAFRVAAADARAAAHHHGDRLADLRDQRREAERELARLRHYPGVRPSEDDQRVKALNASMERAAAEIAELAVVHATRADKAAAVSGLVHRVESWLKELPHSAIVSDAISAPPVVPKKSSVLDMIEARRRRVRELTADRRRVEAAPVPSAIVKARMVAEISRIAEAGAPDVSGAIEGGELVRWPTGTVHVGIAGAGVGSTTVHDALAVVAWLHRDALVKKLCNEVDAIADDANALNDAERADQLAQIERDVLVAEREEVALVELAAEQGTPIAHRSDVAVPALLGIVVTNGEEN
ncbi:hypothetical protein [Rhodoplanes sp. SY1]|uniref:hypothetical protein n=1 Tax=Rhodoplanes sp. SY1 TaxID=3166646 RepID=UPI0038B51121